MKEVKTRKKPMEQVIRVTNLDSKDYSEGKVTYYYSERSKVRPKDNRYKEVLVKQGFHHLPCRDLKNGMMVFIRNARVELEIYTYKRDHVKVYRKDITPLMPKLIGKTASPDSFEELVAKIANRKVAAYIIDGKVDVKRIKVQ